MAFTKVLKFRDLAEKLAQNNCTSSICSLLNIHVRINEYDELSHGRVPEILMFRLNDTWWEVSWPNDDKANVINEHAAYKYIADNIEDLIRLKPDADLPFWQMAYEFANNVIDDDEMDEDFYLSCSRFDTISSNWEYLNNDLCGSAFDMN